MRCPFGVRGDRVRCVVCRRALDLKSEATYRKEDECCKAWGVRDVTSDGDKDVDAALGGGGHEGLDSGNRRLATVKAAPRMHAERRLV